MGEQALLSGRITRRAMSRLLGVVLLVTPIEVLAYDHPLVVATVPLRVGILVLILVGLHGDRIGPIAAGRLFLIQGVITMFTWAVLLDSEPWRIALQTMGYGTILPICTLLIAPKESRRAWAFLVLCVAVYPGIVQLMPDDLLLLGQVLATLAIHSVVVAALDAHANKAEIAGEMAGIDPLTGLMNRRSALIELNTMLSRARESKSAATLLLLDLDHFKQLNDTLGHEAGDDALRRVSEVLTSLVRPVDSVCRWGGEEFIIVLDGIQEAVAVDVAEQLRVGLVDANVTASFGVAQACPKDTVTSWVRRADDAMYRAKRAGRNTVCIAAESDEHERNRRTQAESDGISPGPSPQPERASHSPGETPVDQRAARPASPIPPV